MILVLSILLSFFREIFTKNCEFLGEFEYLKNICLILKKLTVKIGDFDYNRLNTNKSLKEIPMSTFLSIYADKSTTILNSIHEVLSQKHLLEVARETKFTIRQRNFLLRYIH